MSKKKIITAKCSDFFDSRWQVHVTKTEEERGPHLHNHEFIEIAYVASGCGSHKIGDSVYPVSKGDIFVIDYDIAHEFCYDGKKDLSPLIVYNCLFTPGFIDSSLVDSKDFHDLTQLVIFRHLFNNDKSEKTSIRIIGRDTGEIESIFEKMHVEYNSAEKGHIAIVRGCLTELIIKIIRLYERDPDLKNNIYSKRTEITNRVKQYISEKYSENIRLEDLASTVYLTPNYLSRFFKENTGDTVSGYIQKVRVQKAITLLRETDLTVTGVALNVGYRDIKHFNSVFRKITGKSPGNFRGRQG